MYVVLSIATSKNKSDTYPACSIRKQDRTDSCKTTPQSTCKSCMLFFPLQHPRPNQIPILRAVFASKTELIRAKSPLKAPADHMLLKPTYVIKKIPSVPASLYIITNYYYLPFPLQVNKQMGNTLHGPCAIEVSHLSLLLVMFVCLFNQTLL